MPPIDLKTTIRNMRRQMATDAGNDEIPRFSHTDSNQAQAHVTYLMGLRDGDTRLPTFEVETITTYKLKVIPPNT